MIALRIFIALTLLVLGMGVSCSPDKKPAREVMLGIVWDAPEADFETAFRAAHPDAGTLPSYVVPAETSARLFFGELDEDDANDVTGIDDATAVLKVKEVEVPMENEGSGGFLAPGFVYAPGEPHSMTATRAAKSFVVEVQSAPARETVALFHEGAAASGELLHPTGTPLTLQRSAGAEGLGFVTVMPVDVEGFREEQVYSTLPDGLAAYRTLLNPTSYTQTSLTIPGDAFSQPNTVYLVYFTKALTGEASEGLEGTSNLVAGVADVGVVRTPPE